MKKKNLLKLVGIAMLFTLSACNQDIEKFSPGNTFIYFDMPFRLNDFGAKTTVRDTMMSYSFDMDEASVTSYTFKIPVNIIGLSADQDRKYQVEVIVGKTTATDANWDKSTISNLSIKKGSIRDTIYLKVNRTAELKKENKVIALQLTPVEDFTLGYNNLLKMSVSFTDQLNPPIWWTKWLSILGEFSREKYSKWKEIYYLGADPNLERFGSQAGKPLYWDNMPYYTSNIAGSYPSTAMFIRVLKQYFIKNEFYPDGDTSKPRISIPFAR